MRLLGNVDFEESCGRIRLNFNAPRLVILIMYRMTVRSQRKIKLSHTLFLLAS